MTLSIEALFEEYDGKSVEPFRRAARLVPLTEATLLELTAMAGHKSDRVQIGATWVLKDLLENGLVPPAPVAMRLRGLLKTLHRDEALLHVLQCLPFVNMDLPAQRAASLFETLHGLTGTGNAFVRAWAYNGLGLLAGEVPPYRAKVLTLFAAATEHETAAVKARIRHASKALAKRAE